MNKATIYITGIIGQDISLIDVIRQFKSFEDVSTVDVIIDSVGGSVTVGNSIYDYIKGLSLPITTVAKKAYSIAASIFMAGDTRLVEGEAPLMIHLPLVQDLTGNADDLIYVANELKGLEKEFTNFYSQFLDLPKETITALLKQETFLSANEAVEMGFATGIKDTLKAVAFYNQNDTQKNTIMTKSEKFFNAMAKFFKGEEVRPQAIEVQDATGETVDFFELEEGVVPSIGDKANDSEGQPVQGEVVMPSGEIFVFEAGELMEIKPVEEEAEEDALVEEEAAEEDEFDVEKFIESIISGVVAKLQEDKATVTVAQLEETNTKLEAVAKLVGSKSAKISAQEKPKSKNSNYLL